MSKQIGNSLTGLGVLFFQLAESVRWGRARRYCVRVLDVQKCLLCNVYILFSSSNLVAESSVAYRRVCVLFATVLVLKWKK